MAAPEDHHSNVPAPNPRKPGNRDEAYPAQADSADNRTTEPAHTKRRSRGKPDIVPSVNH